MHISSKIYIQNLIKKNNSSGSILFYGLNNGPKFSLAHYAIQMLNCYQLKNQEPCGVCSACVKLKALNHPDLHIILPMPNEKKKLREEPWPRGKNILSKIINLIFKNGKR